MLLVPSLVLVTALLCVRTRGEIRNSSHDFSTESWSGGEICRPCHTPHNANELVTAGPLWNHELSGATYTLYASPTFDSTPMQPRSASQLCLSCHDGTVAVDSFGGAPGSVAITGEANLDTDLGDDHPISIYWNHQTTLPTCSNCHLVHPSAYIGLPFFDRYLECGTCHDVHNTAGNPYLLRINNTGSQLCFSCHNK